MLRAWDARRSRAYAHADGAALADLYVAGSRTGAADRAVLRGYRDRGLRVTGMRTQVLAARVLRESGRRLVLLVTDVLVDAVAGDGRRAGGRCRTTGRPPAAWCWCASAGRGGSPRPTLGLTARSRLLRRRGEHVVDVAVPELVARSFEAPGRPR